MRFRGEAQIEESKWSGSAAAVPSLSVLGSAILSLLACSILLASPVDDS